MQHGAIRAWSGCTSLPARETLTDFIEYVIHVVVEREWAQSVLYHLQDVGRLGDKSAHQPELGITLVGHHERAIFPDKCSTRLELALPVNDIFRPLLFGRNLG